MNLLTLKDHILRLIQDVSLEVLKIYNEDIKVDYKEDKSPITLADKLASDMICEKLIDLTPAIPIICEETKNKTYDERKKWTYVWLVDPIDGTKEFIKKTGEFTINIGLVHNGIPIAGFVGIPVKDIIYYGLPKIGSWKRQYRENNNYFDQKLKTNLFTFNQNNINIVASKSHYNEHTDAFIKRHKNPTILNYGSSLKFLMVAEGTADYYPRMGSTYEWDTCAAHAILKHAGGKLHKYTNELLSEELVYNKENLLNPHFVCVGRELK